MRRALLALALTLCGCFHPFRKLTLLEQAVHTSHSLSVALAAQPTGMPGGIATVAAIEAAHQEAQRERPAASLGAQPATWSQAPGVTITRTQAPAPSSSANYSDAGGRWQCRSFPSMNACMEFCRPVPLSGPRSCSCVEGVACQ